LNDFLALIKRYT